MNLQSTKKRSAQAGLALVEFAIVVPVLLLLVLGLVETGRFMYFGVLVGNAARAGVQYGAQGGVVTASNTSNMVAAAKNDGQNISGLSASATTVCTCWNGSTPNPNPPTHAACTSVCPLGYHLVNYVSVTATGTFSPLFSYPGLPASYNVSRTAIMRISQ